MVSHEAKLRSRVAGRGGFRAGDDRLQLLAEAAQWYQIHDAPAVATALYGAILSLAPNNPLGAVGLGEIALAAGDLETAVRHLERALQAANTDRVTLALTYYRLAQCRYGQNDAARANALWARVKRLDPDGLGTSLILTPEPGHETGESPR